MKSSDPIVFFDDVVPCVECEAGCNACNQQGYFSPGWYFWNETWSDLHGPFKDRTAAEIALVEYARQL